MANSGLGLNVVSFGHEAKMFKVKEVRDFTAYHNFHKIPEPTGGGVLFQQSDISPGFPYPLQWAVLQRRVQTNLLLCMYSIFLQCDPVQ